MKRQMTEGIWMAGLAGAGALLLAQGSAGAATLAEFHLESGTAGAAVTTDNNDASPVAGLTVSTFTASHAWTRDNDQPELAGSLDGEFWVTGSQSLANSTPDGRNFTFTVTPEAGTAIILEEIRFQMGARRDPSELSGRSNSSWTARTSVTINGVTTLVGNLTSPATTAADTTYYDFASLDLTSLADGNPISAPITFLFEYYDGTSQTDKRFMLDNVLLTGDTVVPEPGMLGLLAGAGLLMLRRRNG